MSRGKSIAHMLQMLAFLGILASIACGGGGGGGGGTPAPPPPPTVPVAGITYTAGSAPAQESITLVQGAVSTTELTLEVRAVNVEDLFGVSFDLTFPSSLLRLDSVTEEPWLSSNGAAQTSFLTNDSQAGTLVVGFSRLGAVAGRTGSGTLMTLRFTATGTGSGTFSFSNNEFFDRDGVSVSGISWAGGSVMVQL